MHYLAFFMPVKISLFSQHIWASAMFRGWIEGLDRLHLIPRPYFAHLLNSSLWRIGMLEMYSDETKTNYSNCTRFGFWSETVKMCCSQESTFLFCFSLINYSPACFVQRAVASDETRTHRLLIGVTTPRGKLCVRTEAWARSRLSFSKNNTKSPTYSAPAEGQSSVRGHGGREMCFDVFLAAPHCCAHHLQRTWHPALIAHFSSHFLLFTAPRYCTANGWSLFIRPEGERWR